MSRMFGTDGVRGVAGAELTIELATKLGQAGAYVLTKEQEHQPTLIVGCDTRISGGMLANALMAGICSVGANAIYAGVMPTPAIAYLTRKHKVDAGVVISASHNPMEFNGIKFFNGDGYKLSDALEDEIEELIHKMDKMFSEEGFEKTYQWAVNTIKEYPNCNLLIWQIAVMLDSRRIIGMCENPDRYDEQINSWYEMALSDKDEKIQHYAADSLFGFYLRKKNYEMAEKYLNYFSDYDPMKKVKQGQLYMKQGKKEEAFEMLEKAVFSEYTTLNLAFGIMITKALEEKDHGYARFLAEKMCTLASGFDMGKYNECAAMLNVVTAENNVEGTFQVAKQLLNNVDTICDFQESQLYKHMKFQEVENPYTEEMKKELLEGFRNAEEFAYMKEYEPWKKLLSGN